MFLTYAPNGTKYFKIIKHLGKGTFGRVFLAESPSYDRKVCVKQVVMQNPEKDIQMIREEVYIASQLHHPRIIGFLESFVFGNIVSIVMEYAPGGTLRNVISNTILTPLTQNELLAYFCDILSGLEYLHIRHVIHRDLKPENILLDERKRIKIADFGIAQIHSRNSTKLEAFGTPYYLAPEVFRGDGYDFKTDIWSLGCVLYELCLGQNPFGFTKTLDELKAILTDTQTMFVDCTKLGAQYGSMWMKLCEKMLTYPPSGRFGLIDIIRFDAQITLRFYHLYFDYQY